MSSARLGSTARGLVDRSVYTCASDFLWLEWGPRVSDSFYFPPYVHLPYVDVSLFHPFVSRDVPFSPSWVLQPESYEQSHFSKYRISSHAKVVNYLNEFARVRGRHMRVSCLNICATRSLPEKPLLLLIIIYHYYFYLLLIIYYLLSILFIIYYYDIVIASTNIDVPQTIKYQLLWECRSEQRCANI